jgi:23S rRNA (cytidine1920-2'-O)/16S rRNA (cytidine1409-2'-O)-methyltransferase
VTPTPERRFVSRAGAKLDHALSQFDFSVSNLVCADLGCNAGGFTDCLLQRGAARVYAIDTGYGMLDYGLRKDARVVVMERTNAMHASLPEAAGLVVIDVAWTKQQHILPAARKLVAPGGRVVTLVKPHYEAEPARLIQGKLPEDALPAVLSGVESDIVLARFAIVASVRSPLLGGKRENIEMLYLLQPVA